MKCLRPVFIIGLLWTMLATSNVWAHVGHGHGHGYRGAHVGVVIGIPLTGAWHHPYYDFPAYPYAYLYPPVIAPSAPPIYIERNSAPLAVERQPDYWWHYCPSAQGYYPYVQQCPQDWQPVAPQPSDLK